MSELSVHRFLVSSATGWGRTGLRFRNSGPIACSLTGFPVLSLLDANGPIPLAYLHHGTERGVTLGGGGAAYVIFGKFRCDEGYARVATKGQVWLAPRGRRARFAMFVAVGICRGTQHQARTVTVTPFEPTVSAAYRVFN
jgi:hypothetical protein